MTPRTELSQSLIDALLQRERIILTARLLTGVVHNLSGAVQMISLPLDLAQLSLDKGEVQNMEARLNSVRQGLDRLMGEVGLLATRSLNDQRKQLEPLDLARMAAEQLDFWRGDLFVKHEIKLERELPQGRTIAQTAYVDAALAFNALMSNAVEAMRDVEQPGLMVSAFQQDGRTGLRFRDSGPGPSAEMADRMFEPFTGDKGGEHSGLGLFLAARALEPWGGRVSQEQDASRTTFVMDFASG